MGVLQGSHEVDKDGHAAIATEWKVKGTLQYKQRYFILELHRVHCPRTAGTLTDSEEGVAAFTFF